MTCLQHLHTLPSKENGKKKKKIVIVKQNTDGTAKDNQ